MITNINEISDEEWYEILKQALEPKVLDFFGSLFLLGENWNGVKR